MIQTSTDEDKETWFRFLVKQLKTDISSSNPAYAWYEMGFWTYCTGPNKTIVLCFDVPAVLRARLHDSLSFSSRPEDYNSDSVHMFLTKEAVGLYDDSVWGMRDAIREIERVSANMTAFQRCARIIFTWQ
jgi:hypothetical protein